MNMIAQEARKRQAVVKLARRKGNILASNIYGVSLSSIKRWNKRYDGVSWKSMLERSHRPKRSHPNRHTTDEETLIRAAFKEKFFKYGWTGVYEELADNQGYKRTYWGMRHAAKRMGLAAETEEKKPPRKKNGRFPEIMTPGEKVQLDVKEVPYYCMKGAQKRDGKHLYQWTAIDECTRKRFVYGYEEHTAANSADFMKRVIKAFPFPIKCVQTDNGIEFTYKYISDTEKSPLDELLDSLGIEHVLIPPRTPWHNGKVERSHRTDQRYFYNWERFGGIDEFNIKLAKHLDWYNHRRMAVLGFISPSGCLEQKLSA